MNANVFPFRRIRYVDFTERWMSLTEEDRRILDDMPIVALIRYMHADREAADTMSVRSRLADHGRLA